MGNPGSHLRARHKDAVKVILELRQAIPDQTLAVLLGINIAGLSWQRQPMPVVRAAIMLHLIVFANGSRVKLFDVLTSGRYAGAKVGVAGKRGMPQEPVNDPPA